MKCDYKVSVIIPVYNVEKYLCCCIDSVIGQSYGNLEIILIDDGSDDGSGAICEAYKEKDSRIRVLHQKNSGLSAARNRGLEIGTGEFISFIDSDDWIEEDFIETLVKKQQETGADLVMTGYCRMDEDRKPIGYYPLSEGILASSAEGVLQICMGLVPSYACNKLYKRRIFDSLRFIEGKLYEDVAVMHMIFSKCQKIAVAAGCGYCYRVRVGSTVHQDRNLIYAWEMFYKRYLDLDTIEVEDREAAKRYSLKRAAEYAFTVLYILPADLFDGANTSLEEVKRFWGENRKNIMKIDFLCYLRVVWPGGYLFLRKIIHLIRGKA